MEFGEDLHRSLAARRVDSGGQPVLGIVHQRHRFGVAAHALDADDRAEGLLPHDLHRVVDLGQHARLEEIAAVRQALSSAEAGGPLCLRVQHLPPENLQLARTGHRAQVGRGIPRIAQHEVPNRLDERLHESGVNPAMHVDPLHRAAALTGVVERSVRDGRRRGLHVDVVADIDEILAAELHLELDHPSRRRLGHPLAGGVRAGEKHAVDRLPDEFRADLSAADDGDEHVFRNVRLVKEL